MAPMVDKKRQMANRKTSSKTHIDKTKAGPTDSDVNKSDATPSAESKPTTEPEVTEIVPENQKRPETALSPKGKDSDTAISPQIDDSLDRTEKESTGKSPQEPEEVLDKAPTQEFTKSVEEFSEVEISNEGNDVCSEKEVGKDEEKTHFDNRDEKVENEKDGSSDWDEEKINQPMTAAFDHSPNEPAEIPLPESSTQKTPTPDMSEDPTAKTLKRIATGNSIQSILTPTKRSKPTATTRSAVSGLNESLEGSSELIVNVGSDEEQQPSEITSEMVVRSSMEEEDSTEMRVVGRKLMKTNLHLGGKFEVNKISNSLRQNLNPHLCFPMRTSREAGYREASPEGEEQRQVSGKNTEESRYR